MSRLIDAEEVLNAINRYAKEDGYINLHIGTIDSIISNVPTVERPHGEWIWNTDNHCAIRRYCKCSICRIGMGDTEYDFCPNCGADMRKEGEAE